MYADGKVVALVCDNQMYVKILSASAELEKICDKDTPYPGARPHYLVEENQIESLDTLPSILFDVAKSLPAKKPKKKDKA